MSADAGLPGVGTVVLSLGLILALLGCIAWLLRRLQRRGWVPLQGQQPIHILASRRLGFQTSLMIVEAEGQRFLVGNSRAGVSAIGRLGPADETP